PLEEESNSTKVTIVLDLALEKKARQFEVATNFGKTAHGCCSAPTAIATLATGVVDSAKKKIICLLQGIRDASSLKKFLD
ncbi:Os09g0244200, partial [Oryza sativa Japonica Group]